MGKRLLVIGLIATVLVVTRAGEASACSCAPLTPAVALEEADAAFVGTLIDRPGSETTFVEDAPYTFEVESWVKGDFGSEVVVHAPNQGSACGIEAPVGDRVGLFVTEENGELSSSLCAMVDPDLLLAGDSPLAIDGTGPPVFLVAGYDGPARLMLVDASGGLVAAIGAEGESMNGLAMCPGTDRFVELMNDQMVVRSAIDLTEIRRVDLDNLPYERAVPRIWCRDESGDTMWLSVDDWTESGGSKIRLVDAEDLDQPILEGPYGWLEVGNGFAVGGEGPTAKSIWRIDLKSEERTLLHEVPMDPGDSEPSVTAWVDPTGDRVMIAQWRYRDDTGGNSTFFLYDLTNGELLWQSETMATADGVGWVDQDTFAAYSYPDMNSDVVDNLFIDTTNETIAHLPATPGWQVLRVGEYLAGVMGAHLNVMPIDGGPVDELRLLPSEMHHLAAVLAYQRRRSRGRPWSPRWRRPLIQKTALLRRARKPSSRCRGPPWLRGRCYSWRRCQVSSSGAGTAQIEPDRSSRFRQSCWSTRASTSAAAPSGSSR